MEQQDATRIGNLLAALETALKQPPEKRPYHQVLDLIAATIGPRDAEIPPDQASGATRAIQAIRARINGERDHSSLRQFGPLHTLLALDVLRMLDAAKSAHLAA